MKIDLEKLAVESGANLENYYRSSDDSGQMQITFYTSNQLQAFSEAYAEQENYILLGVLADIRAELGVHDRPMLTELASEVKKLKGENKAFLSSAKNGIYK